MKFSQLVAVLALLSFAAQSNANTDGSLRRSGQTDTAWVQSEDLSEVQQQPTQGVVILNTNSNATQATVQPVTVVEAAPVQDSRAEAMRKARQNAEVQTEQKIVEKLEEDRLREEQERANRLFGSALAPQPQQVQQQQPVQTIQAVPVQTVPAEPEAMVVEDKPQVQQPAQVNIEKIEIIQPAAVTAEKEEVAPSAAQSSMVMPEAKQESDSRFYIGGIMGGSSYDASNVKSNYALGVSVGSLVNNRWGIEGSFLYSNHYIDTFWKPNLYSELDQYEFQASAKYYILSGTIKPYIGGSAAYIYRKYNNRVRNNAAWTANPNDESAETHAMNVGLMAGADFMLSDSILIGGGLDWSRNFANNNGLEFKSYGLPDNTKAIEEIDFYTFKVSAKYLF